MSSPPVEFFSTGEENLTILFTAAMNSQSISKNED